MIVPAILFVLCATALAAALVLPGWSDLMLLAGPSLLASLWLLVAATLRRKRAVAGPPERKVVIDGSNVMHWKGGEAQIGPVRDVVRHLARQGWTTGVVFDANVGYKIEGQYRHDGAMAKMLGLATDMVMVAPRGTPADELLLRAARELDARVVSNDRFRDWIDRFPEITQPGHLITGGYKGGALWLETDAAYEEGLSSASRSRS